MVAGWIKDFRKEIESDIWLMPPLYHRVWQYIKYKVNHEEKLIPMNDGSNFKIFPGQHLTSIRNIAKGVGWYEGLKWKEPNPKTINSILNWMVVKDMVRIDSGQGNRRYTLITIVKWESYQLESIEGNAKVTVNGESRKQSADIKKNVKNVKNDKNKKIYVENSIEFQLSLKLKFLILKNNPKAKISDIQKWCIEFNKMIRIDKRSLQDIQTVISFSQEDNFWKCNILSAKKLREKFDQLYLQCQSKNLNNKSISPTHPSGPKIDKAPDWFIEQFEE